MGRKQERIYHLTNTGEGQVIAAIYRIGVRSVEDT
jgi:hypothetical protein